jgi:anti-anti-sigma factor
MNTTFEEKDGKYIMHFEGRLDTAASIKTEQEMKVLYDCEGHDIILDCEKLEYISSSGLRLFLSLLKGAKTKGSKVSVAHISDSLRQVFAMTGFTNLFEFV